MTNRGLVLRRETLTELTAADLGGVVAGAPESEKCPSYSSYCITGYAMCGEGLDTRSVLCP